MAELSTPGIRETVRERYAAAAGRAANSEEGCCGSSVGCSDEFGAALYGDEASAAPGAAVSASLGCGVPTAVADLHEGETVLDLGPGVPQGLPRGDPAARGPPSVVISNCVINLAADKRVVLAAAARVLRPGGRFAVSDVIADEGMDGATRADMAQWTGCIAGATDRGRVPGRAGGRRVHRRGDPPDAPRPRARRLGDRPCPHALTAN